jgi:hypothetical protein
MGDEFGLKGQLHTLREALALSRRLVSKSKTLIDETERARETSWKAIEETHAVLKKARELDYRVSR